MRALALLAAGVLSTAGDLAFAWWERPRHGHPWRDWRWRLACWLWGREEWLLAWANHHRRTSGEGGVR